MKLQLIFLEFSHVGAKFLVKNMQIYLRNLTECVK